MGERDTKSGQERLMKLRELIKEKGAQVIAVPGDTPISEAVLYMASKNVGALIVVTEDKRIGMFTERDVVKLWAAGMDFTKRKIGDDMISDIFIAQADDDVEYAMTIMIQKGIRHLPVLDKGRLAGVISMRDVVKVQVKNLHAEVRYMKDFFTSGSIQDSLSDMS